MAAKSMTTMGWQEQAMSSTWRRQIKQKELRRDH